MKAFLILVILAGWIRAEVLIECEITSVVVFAAILYLFLWSSLILKLHKQLELACPTSKYAIQYKKCNENWDDRWRYGWEWAITV